MCDDRGLRDPGEGAEGCFDSEAEIKILRGIRGTRILDAWQHRCAVLVRPILVEPHDVQWDERVLHPEGVAVMVPEKEHSVEIPKVGDSLEPLAAKRGVVSYSEEESPLPYLYLRHVEIDELRGD